MIMHVTGPIHPIRTSSDALSHIFMVLGRPPSETRSLHGGPQDAQGLVKATEKAAYVLSPLFFQAKLCQFYLDHYVNFPKYLVHSKLSSLSIRLSKNQRWRALHASGGGSQRAASAGSTPAARGLSSTRPLVDRVLRDLPQAEGAP